MRSHQRLEAAREHQVLGRASHRSNGKRALRTRSAEPSRGAAEIDVQVESGTARQVALWEARAQLQHQLDVTGYRWGSVAVLLFGCRMLWADVERDEPFIERLRAAEAEFWGRVEAREPRDATAYAELQDQLGVPATVELVRPGDLLDCESLLKTPVVYKPAPMVDWRGSDRRPYTMMDALISLPGLTLSDLRRVAGRALRTYLSKRRL